MIYDGLLLRTDEYINIQRGDNLDLYIRGCLCEPESFFPSSWLEINLTQLTHNLNLTRHLAGESVHIIAVCKSDAYGHGLERIALSLWREGVTFFGVADYHEALRLRALLPKSRILCLYPVLDWQHEELIKNRVELTISNTEIARKLQYLCGRLQTPCSVHLQLETGLNHCGAAPSEGLALSRMVDQDPNLSLAGVGTHLAGVEGDYTNTQLKVFEDFITELKQHGIHIPLVHVANSYALERFPATYSVQNYRSICADIQVGVRVGGMLYGTYSFRDSELPSRNHYGPLMTSLVSHVAEAKRVGKNEMIGYFGAYQAENDMYIGLVPLGWGQRNFYANTNGQAISDNQLCSIVGLISANNLVIASRLAPFRRGQRVYFLGPYAGGALTLDDLANASQSFIPRVVSQIGRSIERVYYLEES